jgi:hypothetical protein
MGVAVSKPVGIKPENLSKHNLLPCAMEHSP